MAQVHPTSIVGEQVELGDGVEIGPGCILDGRIKIGAGTRLIHRVSLQGPLTLGEHNMLYPNVCIGFAPQDLKFAPAQEGAGTVIGNDNIFREGFSSHRATKDRPTSIGNGNYFMCNAHVAHDCTVGSGTMLANGALMGGHAEISDNVILGGNSAVHQFCRVGRLGMLSGVAAISLDVPPFCVVYVSKTIGSLNIIGLRRAGLGKHIRPLKQAFDLLFRARLARENVIARIMDELGDDPLCVELADFVNASKRGITHYGGTRGDVALPEAAEAQV